MNDSQKIELAKFLIKLKKPGINTTPILAEEIQRFKVYFESNIDHNPDVVLKNLNAFFEPIFTFYENSNNPPDLLTHLQNWVTPIIESPNREVLVAELQNYALYRELLLILADWHSYQDYNFHKLLLKADWIIKEHVDALAKPTAQTSRKRKTASSNDLKFKFENELVQLIFKYIEIEIKRRSPDYAFLLNVIELAHDMAPDSSYQFNNKVLFRSGLLHALAGNYNEATSLFKKASLIYNLKPNVCAAKKMPNKAMLARNHDPLTSQVGDGTIDKVLISLPFNNDAILVSVLFSKILGPKFENLDDLLACTRMIHDLSNLKNLVNSYLERLRNAFKTTILTLPDEQKLLQIEKEIGDLIKTVNKNKADEYSAYLESLPALHQRRNEMMLLLNNDIKDTGQRIELIKFESVLSSLLSQCFSFYQTYLANELCQLPTLKMEFNGVGFNLILDDIFYHPANLIKFLNKNNISFKHENERVVITVYEAPLVNGNFSRSLIVAIHKMYEDQALRKTITQSRIASVERLSTLQINDSIEQFSCIEVRNQPSIIEIHTAPPLPSESIPKSSDRKKQNSKKKNRISNVENNVAKKPSIIDQIIKIINKPIWTIKRIINSHGLKQYAVLPPSTSFNGLTNSQFSIFLKIMEKGKIVGKFGKEGYKYYNAEDIQTRKTMLVMKAKGRTAGNIRMIPSEIYNIPDEEGSSDAIVYYYGKYHKKS